MKQVVKSTLQSRVILTLIYDDGTIETFASDQMTQSRENVSLPLMPYIHSHNKVLVRGSEGSLCDVEQSLMFRRLHSHSSAHPPSPAVSGTKVFA